MIGYAQLLQEELRDSAEGDTPQQLAHDLRRIAEESERAAKIVRNLLAFARRHLQRRDVGDLVGRELGLSPTRYFQLLLAMLERPEVAATDPELVTRLRAMRDRRRRR